MFVYHTPVFYWNGCACQAHHKPDALATGLSWHQYAVNNTWQRWTLQSGINSQPAIFACWSSFVYSIIGSCVGHKTSHGLLVSVDIWSAWVACRLHHWIYSSHWGKYFCTWMALWLLSLVYSYTLEVYVWILPGNRQQKDCCRPATEHLCPNNAQVRPCPEEVSDQGEGIGWCQCVAGTKYSSSSSDQTSVDDAQRHGAQLRWPDDGCQLHDVLAAVATKIAMCPDMAEACNNASKHFVN